MTNIKEFVKNNLKYILNTAFIVLIMWLTFRLLFHGQEFSEILDDLHTANGIWLGIGLLLVFLFVSSESVIIKYMLRLFGEKIPFLRCLKYSFIGFFFSYITPSASGGQPAQMFYMKKDGVKIGYSTLIMLVITIAYKSALVILGLITLAFNYSFLRECVGGMWWLLLLGFVLNIACIVAFAFVFFKPLWARKMCIKIVNLLTGMKIVKAKNNEKLVTKITRICDNYIVGADYIKDNVHTVVNVFIITLIQRIFLFAVTWVVYRAFGLSGTGFLQIIALQIMIGISVEMLPLPGAAGITEGCFVYMFADIFGGELVKPALLLSRGLSFYALLIGGGVITLVAHIIYLRKNKGIEDEEK